MSEDRRYIEMTASELILCANGVELLEHPRAEELAAWLKQEAKKPSKKLVLDCPKAVLQVIGKYANEKKEHLLTLYLDAAHRLLKLEVVSIGTLTASLVHPREVYAPALALPAAAIIVAHNHPSGDPNPSREDRETTRRISEAGRILGVPLLDHVILGRNAQCFSFRERGLMEA